MKKIVWMAVFVALFSLQAVHAEDSGSFTCAYPRDLGGTCDGP